MSERYRTKIRKHIRMASSQLLKNGEEALTMQRVAAEAGVPYTTIRRYVNQELDNPNFAIVDRIRRYLNQFYTMSDEGYIYPINEPGATEEAEAGQPAAAS